MVRSYGDGDRKAFWGDTALPLADQLLDEAASEVKQEVAAKVAAAGARLALMISGFSPESAEVLLRLKSGSSPRTSAEHTEPAVCPVCRQQGWLLCSIDRGAVEWEVDEDGLPSGAMVDVTAWPEAFECPVCRPYLDFPELAEFDFPMEISLEGDSDPFEVYEWEPDEDEFRGR